MKPTKQIRAGKSSVHGHHDRKVNHNTEVENVEIRLMFTPGPDGGSEASMEVSPGVFRQVKGSYHYTIIVRSTRFPRSKLVAEVPVEKITAQKHVSRYIGVVAGALCEDLNERFGDNVDPSEVARNAELAFLEMRNEQRSAFLQSTA